jgi:hypothetical protein
LEIYNFPFGPKVIRRPRRIALKVPLVHSSPHYA